jgi:hypothetical protein
MVLIAPKERCANCALLKISAYLPMETETMNIAVKTASSEKLSSCVARQPILSKDEKVLGTNCCSAIVLKKIGLTPIWKEAPAASSTH